MNTWTEAFALGQKYEKLTARLFATSDVSEIWFPPGKHSGFDFEIIDRDNTGNTYEVKADRNAYNYGSLCIEYQHNGAPSGILATTADYWVHWVVGPDKRGRDDYCFKIPVEVLKQAFNDHKYNRLLSGGDYKRSQLAIFPMGLFENYRVEVPQVLLIKPNRVGI